MLTSSQLKKSHIGIHCTVCVRWIPYMANAIVDSVRSVWQPVVYLARVSVRWRAASLQSLTRTYNCTAASASRQVGCRTVGRNSQRRTGRCSQIDALGSGLTRFCATVGIDKPSTFHFTAKVSKCAFRMKIQQHLRCNMEMGWTHSVVLAL
jgi:hypothetical protein